MAGKGGIPLGVVEGQRGNDFKLRLVSSVTMSSEPTNRFEVGFDGVHPGF